MAMFTRTLTGTLGQVMTRVKSIVLDGSASASLEEEWTAQEGEARCATLVFERYSYAGGNRVSMAVTLFQNGDGPVRLCAITSGGSQAMFFKINTWGEETFLDTLKDGLD